MSEGRSVRLFLVDGTPGGLITAEIMNWTGTVVAAPRSLLAELLRRDEATGTGIYLLLGDDPEQLGGTLAYIGEGDDVPTRLRQHARQGEANGKDFWNRAIVLASKDANLTKSHVRYVESRFIALANNAGRAKLENATAPPVPRLPEADISDMEYFISQALIVLPVLGINIFRSSATPTNSTGTRVDRQPTSSAALAPSTSPTFELRIGKSGIVATAKEFDSDFTVLAGSGVRAQWIGPHSGYQTLHQQLVADGSIVVGESAGALFTRDVAFASPSAAGAVVSGRSSNGRTEWRVQGTAETYGQWQNRGLDDAAGEPAID